jgi:putative nucleotidyltransferase with HDIG domain
MDRNNQVKRVVYLIAILAGVGIVFTFLRFPLQSDVNYVKWWQAAATLLALATLSMMLYLKATVGGSTTSMDFVPELGSILLIGPAGAVLVTVVSEFISEFILFRHKPAHKKLFNMAQLILAVAAAGYVFKLFGGMETVVAPDSYSDWFRTTLPPFFLAVLAYFAVNSGTVAYILSIVENKGFLESWRSITGGLIVFDIAMSPLAFLVAFLYLKFDAWALFLAIIPLIGLRYSYGINFELKQLNSDLLRLMVKTIEAQDPYTSGHSIRVAATASRIARTIGVGSRDQLVIETAALLHDIGKIDIAYSEILRQKGPLSPEQRELIRAHPDRGVDIIKSIRSIRPEVLSCVKHHHERFDGDGYPDGLTGDEIPLGSRIIMVCDTIDAMTTARPYRDALPVSVVRDELIRHRGTQFDPQVVDILLTTDVLDKVEAESVGRRTTISMVAGVTALPRLGS